MVTNRASLKSLFLFLALSLSCFAQTTLPNTPAAQQFGAWLQAFNQDDRAAYQEFLRKMFPSQAEHLDDDWRFRQMTCGFALKKVEAGTSTKFAALVQERNSDQFGKLDLEVEAVEPHRIVHLDLKAIPRPAEFPVPHMSEDELIAAVSNEVERDAAGNRFAGAVLLAKNGKAVFTGAYGLADHEHKVRNTLKTRFRIGSMNKMFTAVATLQLVQAGKLQLDDPLRKYLTDYPNKDVDCKGLVDDASQVSLDSAFALNEEQSASAWCFALWLKGCTGEDLLDLPSSTNRFALG